MKKIKTIVNLMVGLVLVAGMMPVGQARAEETETEAETCAASESVSDGARVFSDGGELVKYVNETLAEEYAVAVAEDASVKYIEREVKLAGDVTISEVLKVPTWLRLTWEIGDYTVDLAGSGERMIEVMASASKLKDTKTLERGELTILAGSKGVMTNENGTGTEGLIRNSGKLTLRCGKYVGKASSGGAIILNGGKNEGMTFKIEGILDIDGAVMTAGKKTGCIKRSENLYTSEITKLKNMRCDAESWEAGARAVSLSIGGGIRVENVKIHGMGEALAALNRNLENVEISVIIKDSEFSGYSRGLYLYGISYSNARKTNVEISGVKASGGIASGMVIAAAYGSEQGLYANGVKEITDGEYVGATDGVRFEKCAEGGACNGDLMTGEVVKLISGGEYSSNVEESGYVKDGYKAYAYGEGRYIVDKELLSVTATAEKTEVYEDEETQMNVVTDPLVSKTGVTYESSDEEVLTVDGTGKVTAKSVGKATVTATATFDSTITDAVEIAVKKRPTVLSGKYETESGAGVKGSVELAEGVTKTLEEYKESVGLVMTKSAGEDVLGVYTAKLVDENGVEVDTALAEGQKWTVKVKLDEADVTEDDDYYTVNGEKVEYDEESGEIGFEVGELGEFTVGVVKKSNGGGDNTGGDDEKKDDEKKDDEKKDDGKKDDGGDGKKDDGGDDGGEDDEKKDDKGGDDEKKDEELYIDGTQEEDGGSNVVFPEGVKVKVEEATRLMVGAENDEEVLMAAGSLKDLIGVYNVRFVKVESGDEVGVRFEDGTEFQVNLQVGAENMKVDDIAYKVFYVDDAGGLTEMRKVTWDKKAGIVSFWTTHLSDYAVQAVRMSASDSGADDGGETGGNNTPGQSDDADGDENETETGGENVTESSGEVLAPVEADIRKVVRRRIGVPDTGMGGETGMVEAGAMGWEVAGLVSVGVASGVYVGRKRRRG